MSDELDPAILNKLDELNERAIKNRFFVPDRIYADLGLFKDFPIGAAYLDPILTGDRTLFDRRQAHITQQLPEYQIRRFDSVSPYFDDISISDEYVNDVLGDVSRHDRLFVISPRTWFINTLIRHALINQNHSAPAEKYEKVPLEVAGYYTLKPTDVELILNTYPLSLPQSTIAPYAALLGETLGMNIVVISRNPETFDDSDWDKWLGKVDCFYLDSLSRFLNSPTVNRHFSEMDFAGKFVYARKRMDRHIRDLLNDKEIESELADHTAVLMFQCEFVWLPNNDVRLTESEITGTETSFGKEDEHPKE